MIAAENQVLRRWPAGPPAPELIPTTARHRGGRELLRTPVAIAAAPALGAPPALIYGFADRGAHRSLAARAPTAPTRGDTAARSVRSHDGGVAATSLRCDAAGKPPRARRADVSDGGWGDPYASEESFRHRADPGAGGESPPPSVGGRSRPFSRLTPVAARTVAPLQPHRRRAIANSWQRLLFALVPRVTPGHVRPANAEESHVLRRCGPQPRSWRRSRSAEVAGAAVFRLAEPRSERACLLGTRDVAVRPATMGVEAIPLGRRERPRVYRAAGTASELAVACAPGAVAGGAGARSANTVQRSSIKI